MSYKEDQQQARKALKPRPLKGYRFNAATSRAVRRQTDDKEFYGENVQTMIQCPKLDCDCHLGQIHSLCVYCIEEER